MEESLRGGLSLTTSGFGYWSHDIGGFESTSTPDVYKRWCAFGLLSSHSRLHGSTSYRVPWAYDEESVDVVRFFAKLKASLMPYLYRNAVETSETGIPMMRSMVLEFQGDKNVEYLSKEYMFGDSLLVAPIFNEDSMAEYYLPEGNWTHLLTGEKKTGGKWYKEDCGYLSIPLYAREGSIVALGAKNDGPEYDYADDVRFNVFELAEGKTASTVVYNMKAEKEAEITVTRSKDSYVIETLTEKPYQVVLVNVTNVASVENGTLTMDGNNAVIKSSGAGKIVVNLK